MPRKKTNAPPRPILSPSDPLPSVFDRVLSNLDHSTLRDSFNSELTQALEGLPPDDARRFETGLGNVMRWMQSGLLALKIDDPSARLKQLRTGLDSVRLLDLVQALEMFGFVDNAAKVFDEIIRSSKTNSEANIESVRGILQVLMMNLKRIWENSFVAYVKKNDSLVDRVEQIHSYWRETMTSDQKHRLVRAKVEDLKLYLSSFQNVSGLKLFSEAVDFFSQNKTWNNWICCRCGKEFKEEELIGEHYWQIHLESLSPDLLSVLPEEVDKEWAETIENGESWKPVDTAKALEAKQATLKFQDWPISDDLDRIALVAGIHGLLRSFHKKKCLSQYLLQLMIEYTVDKLERAIPKAKLTNHGLHKTPRCILFLEVPEMVEMFSILNKIAASCHLTESSETESLLPDMITHQEFELKEWVRSSSDFSSIILNIVADNESWPEIDTFIYWLFSAPKLQTSLSLTSNIREKRKDFGMKIFVKFEEALKTLAKECTALCECLNFYEEAVVVSNTCLEELDARELQTRESFFSCMLEKLAQKGVEKEMSLKFLHFILNLKEDIDGDDYDDDESRSGESNDSSNKGEFTKDGIRKAIIKLRRRRTIEISMHEAKLMRFKATMDHWKVELKQTAANDYSSILTILMMSLTRAKMVNLVERDVEEKAEAAAVSLLADIAIEAETSTNKKGDNIKKLKKNSKQRKRNKNHTKAKKKEPCDDEKLTPNHDQVKQDPSSAIGYHKLEICSPVGVDESKQTDEDLKHNTEVEEMAKMLEERLEFQRQFEKEVKESHLNGKNKKTNETTANDPDQEEEDYLSKEKLKVALEEDTEIIPATNGINSKNDSDMGETWMQTDFDAAEKANAVIKDETSIKKGGADKTKMNRRPTNFKEACDYGQLPLPHDSAEQDHCLATHVGDSPDFEHDSSLGANKMKNKKTNETTNIEEPEKELEEVQDFQMQSDYQAEESKETTSAAEGISTKSNGISFGSLGITRGAFVKDKNKLGEDPVQDYLSEEKLKVSLGKDTMILPTTNDVAEKGNAVKEENKVINEGGAEKIKIYVGSENNAKNFKEPHDDNQVTLHPDSAEQVHCSTIHVGDSHDFEHYSSLRADEMNQLDEDLKHKTDIEELRKEELQKFQMQSDNQAEECNEATSLAEHMPTKRNEILLGSFCITVGAFDEDKKKLGEVLLKDLLGIPLVKEETKISPTNYHVSEHNCFLNAIIKSLWRLRSFRENFLSHSRESHSHFPDPCIVCVLYDMFTSLSTGSREITSSASLKIALSNLHPDGNFYQEGEMNEPSELIGVLLFRLHLASIDIYPSQKFSDEESFRESWNCDSDLCFSHPFFRMKFLEKMVCQNCDLESMKSIHSSFIDYIYAGTLREIKNSNGDSTFSQLLELDQMKQPYPCDPDAGGCSSRGFLTRSLVNHPHIYTIDLGWQSVSESAEDISATLAIVTAEIDVSNTGIKYHLISMVCFHELHYFCLARSHEHENWILNDDRHVKVVGCWDDVRILCGKCHFQPQLLFFEAVE